MEKPEIRAEVVECTTAVVEPPKDDTPKADKVIKIRRVFRVTKDTLTPIRACKHGCACLQVAWK